MKKMKPQQTPSKQAAQTNNTTAPSALPARPQEPRKERLVSMRPERTPLPSAPATREMRAQAAGDNQASEAGARGDRRKLLYLAIGGICAAIGLALLVVALVYAGKRKPRRPPRPGSSVPPAAPVRQDALAARGALTSSCRWMNGARVGRDAPQPLSLPERYIAQASPKPITPATR